MPTIHDVACTTFTFKCAYGCTVNVIDGQEQDHACTGASAIVDAMRVFIGGTVLEQAQHVAKLLAPLVREQSHNAWVTGVNDGRSGRKFFGVDDDA